MTETDFCIVGGGVMGLATAFALTKSAKRNVLLLDRYGISNELCSSNDINRVFRYAYGSDKLYTQMAEKSLKLWHQIEQESGRRLLVPSGFLMMYGADENWSRFVADSYKTLKELGLNAESLEEAELKRRFPQFAAEKAILDPYAGALLAAEVLETLHSAVEGQGVKTLAGEQIVKLHLSDNPEVETSGGKRIHCKKLIVTTGVWSNQLLRDGLTKIKPTRQHLIYFKPNSSITRFQPPQFPIFFIDNYYGIPAVGIDGVKATYHGLPEEVDPDTANRTVDPEVIETLRRVLRKYVPELASGRVVHSKVCIYDMTENSDFVISADPEYPNVVYGYGFSGHGFKFAPLIGQLLVELALEESASFPLDRFSAVR
jgi:sarcosine oxidase